MDTVIDQSLTDQFVNDAIRECAKMYYHGNIHQFTKMLLAGYYRDCKCVLNNLAYKIGAFLGETDKTVKAVYQFEPLSSAREASSRKSAKQEILAGIHLIIWSEKKSAALQVLANGLVKTLAESMRKMGCSRLITGEFVIDINIINDEQVQKDLGLGIFAGNRMLRSQPVWQRSLGGTPYRHGMQTNRIQVALGLDEPFDPDLVPESRLIEHAFKIEKMPPEKRASLQHYLTELKVTLIRRMISDQLAFIDIAKRWFTIEFLSKIYDRRIGYGKIGGKAAGLMLASEILQQTADEETLSKIVIPESYFIGSDLIYIFMAMNSLMDWNNQKYKPEEQIRSEYPKILQEFQAGKFPPDILEELANLLDRVGNKPLIVRSSSQLEDNFGTSFAGKYDSYYCPNQGTSEENLQALTQAIAGTYASTLNPDALLYRRSKGLQDYDERMAILIQVVVGEKFGRYYMPHGSGVAFSQNIYRWSPRIRREDGFARLVWGLGTRAVQRYGNDYPRLVALSHPTLQPDDSTEAIRHYSQQYVDLIDLEENTFRTLPVHEVLKPNYPPLRLITQIEQDGFFVVPRMRVWKNAIPQLAVTFHSALKNTEMAPLLSKVLNLLEKHYQESVNIEFAVTFSEPSSPRSPIKLTLLQCRPQSQIHKAELKSIPEDIPADKLIFASTFMVPQGYLGSVYYVIFVNPQAYFKLAKESDRTRVGQYIGNLNQTLREKSFICVGPGRWGTRNLDLGVYVSYADIHHAGALVELSGKGIGPTPEPSLGTHFFQDLMEAQIYPLALKLDDKDTVFSHSFFYETPNTIGNYLQLADKFTDCIRLLDVRDYLPEHHLELVMDDEVQKAVAYLAPDEFHQSP